MAKALIVFASRTGATKLIGEHIAEGIRAAGMEAMVANAGRMQKAADLAGYDALIFGSATYHGDMMQAMKVLLFLAEKADLGGKVGGAFGAFGWSGEAQDRIFDTMKNIFQMDMVGGPLRLKSATAQGGVQAAQDYGKEIASKVQHKR